jgi:hypothetical protein
MLNLLALLALNLPGLGVEALQADPQRAKSAAAELERAWKSESAGDRVRAIQANGNVPDAEVLKLVARGLRDKEVEVQRAAIEALRWVGHPDALKELQALARDEKAFEKDPLLYAALLRAVGQYGSASSIRILGDDLWSVQEQHVLQARILGLGRIRTRESLERLLDLMKVAGLQRIEALMPDFRLALVVLTGADQGNSQPGWQNWWNDHRALLKIAQQPPELPKDLERKWRVYWGEMEGDDRPRKRSERGRDGPP